MQSNPHKLRRLKSLIIPLLLANTLSVFAASKDDPLITMLMAEQLEFRQNGSTDISVIEGHAWIGKDLNKLWFKVELERVNGATEEAELQALYSRAYAPFWDFQIGLRQDFQPSFDNKPSVSWAVLGFQGLAPYFFEVDSALFIGENGRSALRFSAEYELLFTQQLILTPEIEINLYAQNDPDLGLGSGLSDIEFGLRLRYEIRRELAPYIGINWAQKYGNSADFARAENEKSSETQWLVGLRAWF